MAANIKKENLLALVALAISTLIIMCWLFGQGSLSDFPKIFEMKMNTALCIALGAISILVLNRKDRVATILPAIIAILLLIISTTTLLEYISRASFGIDQLFITDKSNVHLAHPGRMSIPTAVCIFLLGTVIFYFARIKTLRSASLIYLLLLTILVASFAGFAINLFRLSVLYDWANFGFISMQTALCFILLVNALWLSWRQDPKLYQLATENVIRLTAIFITIFMLILIAIVFLV